MFWATLIVWNLSMVGVGGFLVDNTFTGDTICCGDSVTSGQLILTERDLIALLLLLLLLLLF